MKRGLMLAFLMAGFVVLCGSWTVASAKDNDNGDNKSDFALFDGTNLQMQLQTPAPCVALGSRATQNQARRSPSMEL